MASSVDTDILLQSDTNELEFVEMCVNEIKEDGKEYTRYYGINVAKIKEIINTPDVITEVPNSHSALEGIMNIRGKVIPAINLPKWLGKYHADLDLKRVIITEFNHVLNGFMVSEVVRIHRVSWGRIEPPTSIISDGEDGCVTGIVKFDDKIIIMLDLEKIIFDLTPDISIQSARADESLEEKRRGKNIVIAEDSGPISKMICKTMFDAGYNVKPFPDGLACHDYMMDLAQTSVEEGRPITDYINLLITDIEMPQMDGLHLLSKVRAKEEYADVPVIIFSSMATEDNIRKWQYLNANEYISKPDMPFLLSKVDKHALTE